MQVGSVVGIYAALAGYRKYHLCLKLAETDSAACFLFINSDPKYAGSYVVDCERLPFLKPSDTGKSCFSFTMVPRHNQHQLEVYQAEVLGEIDLDLALELRAYADDVRTLSRPELAMVKSSLDAIIKRLSGG